MIMIHLAALVDLLLMPKRNMVAFVIILYYLSYEGNEILNNVYTSLTRTIKNLWLRQSLIEIFSLV